MNVPSNEDRRSAARFKHWVACSLLVPSDDPNSRESFLLGHVTDISRDAVGILLPKDSSSIDESYGIEATRLGTEVELTLAVPLGYVRLSGTLVRYSPQAQSGDRLLVFEIQDSDGRSKYDAYLDTLPSEWSAANLLKFEAQEALDELSAQRLLPFKLKAMKVCMGGLGDYVVHFYDSRLHSVSVSWNRNFSFKEVVREAVINRVGGQVRKRA